VRFQVFMLLMCFAACTRAGGDPLCGVPPDMIFKARFEASDAPPPPYNPAPVLPAENTPLSLVVSYPAEGITVGSPTIQVYGTFTGPPNTGVAVDGVNALQSGTSFLGRSISLEPGTNTITVKITSAAGVTQTISRTVTFDSGQAPDAELKSAYLGGYAPFSMRFLVSLKSGIANPIIERIRIDYDGDSTFDTDTTDPTTRLSHRFIAPGIYVANIELTLNDGNTMTPPVMVTATHRVIGEDLDVTRASLCKAFEAFREKLIAQQYTQSLQSFNADVRPDYVSFIEGLGTNGAILAGRLGEIVDGTIGQDSAQLTLAKPRAGQPGRFRSSPLQFSRDSDGVWRISAL